MNTMQKSCEVGRMVRSASLEHARTTVNWEHAMHGRLPASEHQGPRRFLVATLADKPMGAAAPDHLCRQPTAPMRWQTGQSSCREGATDGGVTVATALPGV